MSEGKNNLVFISFTEIVSYFEFSELSKACSFLVFLSSERQSQEDEKNGSADFPPRRSVFELKSSNVGFVVEKAAPGVGLLLVPRFPHQPFFHWLLHTHQHL
jgi:hypothetical protein